MTDMTPERIHPAQDMGAQVDHAALGKNAGSGLAGETDIPAADVPLPCDADLATRMAACRICREMPLGGAARALPHPPRPIFVLSARAPVLIASQAPGIRAHESGVPFNDPSGNRLRQWLGVDRTLFYDPDNFAILPMGFCFPGHDRHGGDLPPRKECAPAWREQALATMPGLRLVLTIGAYAQAYHLRPGTPMTETVAGWRAVLDASEARAGAPATLPLPHPSWRNSAWLKRNPWFEAELLPELQARIRALIFR